MNVFVVVPTYNEAGNILELIKRIKQSVDATILVVDDNSPDGTAKLVQDLHDDRVRVIERAAKLGLGSAYKTGFNEALLAGAEMVVQMDADLSHDPADIKRLIDAAAKTDLVVGSRYTAGGAIRGWGLFRHLISRGAMFFARLVLSLETHDVTSGFRLWRAPLLQKILRQPLRGDGYAFQEEMLFRAKVLGGRILEIPIVFTDRRVGQSKLSWHDVTEFFRLMIDLRRRG